jgi:flagellum-specific ATP synthase
MNDVTGPEQQRAARAFRRIYSLYQQNRDLISVGAYQRGGDEQIDQAIALMPRLLDFLRQDMHEQVTLESSVEALFGLLPQSTVAALRARGSS